MRLLRLHVDNFGTLRDFDLSFEAGMNVLYQKNGWGKSTLAVFIKAMLYGLPATSKRSLDENERKKYAPWQGGTYGGSLELETDRGSFRIERTFGAKESGDTFALFDLATNLPSSAYSSSLGEELFGIDADGFERSTYLSQRALTGGKDNNSISAKLGNLLDDVGDIGNYDTAIGALDRRRRYYVMSGNRGAIAELEQQILERQAELERLRRTETAMRAQEAELAELDEELAAVRRTSAENRRRLEQAGLARERAALTERRNRMLAEVNALKDKKKRLNAYFDGEPPAPEALEEQKRLWERIGGARARLEMIATEPSETLLRLRAKFPSGTPNGEDLERAERDNELLRELRIRCEAKRATDEGDGLSRRFAKGVPDQPTLDRAFEQLSYADKLRRELDAFPVQEKEKPSLHLPIVILFLALGAALAVLGFLPALAATAVPLIGGGAAVMAVGVILWIVFASLRAKNLRAEGAAREGRARLRENREHALAEVKNLLVAYGLPTDDPGRSLTELTLSAERYRENAAKHQRLAQELAELEQRCEKLQARLHAYLARFFGGFGQKADYGAELERLRRDSEALLQAERDERRRASDRAAAESGLRELKLQLQPFLRRYDPNGELRASECLERVSEQMTEYRRVCRELTQREGELASFIAEKRLDEPTPADDATAFERLSAEEKTLQERAASLERRCANAKSGVERLQTEVDRIPEVEEQLSRLRLRLTEAKANAETIKATASFLEEAKLALSTRYLGDMQSSFGEFLSALVGGEAPEAVIDASFAVSLRPDGGQTRQMESFSRGWRDAVELCVRLSLTEALYAEGEKPFLLLDDPFVNLDDERLRAARGLLEGLAEKYQILYLVCHSERI